VAVAATTRLEDQNHTMRDGECFEAFLDKQHRIVIKIEFRGELHIVPHIFYKWFRCELVHKGGLPMVVQFIDTDAMFIRSGGAPEYVLKILKGWFYWLVNAVLVAPCNANEFKKPLSTIYSGGPLKSGH